MSFNPRTGLWKPVEPDWLLAGMAEETAFLRSLRETETMTSTALEIREPAPSKMLRPVAPIGEVVAQQNELRAYIAKALVEDRDWGTIPGVKKPSLLKPGAERINTAYGVMPRFSIIHQEVDHHAEVTWQKRPKYGDPESGISYGLYAYTVRCELVNRATGEVVADCIGACSSMESKYIDRPRDSQNTVLKMAEKRAYVGATLLAYGLSDQFTQDVEDLKGSSGVDSGQGDSENGRANPAPRKASSGGSGAGTRMPFGKSKGKLLSDLDNKSLTDTLAWCQGKDAAKFADLIASIEAELDGRRGDEEGQQSTDPTTIGARTAEPNGTNATSTSPLRTGKAAATSSSSTSAPTRPMSNPSTDDAGDLPFDR